MKRNRDDEDDDSDDFVTIGTPLPLYDEDEIPVRKPVTLQDQSVRDAQGRIRFHGAFTGGFSAGYFNTVDTKEGWTPRTFKSSRSQKTEDSQIGQKPEDFMDDEDFSEFGIAPKKVATTKNFTDSENVRKRKAATESHRSDDSLFGSSHLMDLVMPCRSSMGVRLLRKLGWRDSQGIGPRERKRKRPRQGKLKPSGSAETESIQESQKKYGCAPPPGLHRPPGGGESDGRSSDEDNDDDDGLDGITFAPHDVCPINFDPKANVHGLGYRGIDPTTTLFHGNRLNPLPVKTKGRRLGIRGQAFGVGAFEEDDDDIYGVESMTNYDFQIGNDDHKESSTTHGWTAPKHATEKRSFEEILKNKDVLDGFRCVSTSILPKTNYPPPQLPRDFRPFHVFESTLAKKESVVRSTDGGAKMNAFSRGDLLGERPHLRSIFELVSAEDKAKMEAARMQLDLKNTSQQQQHQPAVSDEPPKESPVSAATRLDEAAGSSRDAEVDNKAPDNKGLDNKALDEPKRFSGFMPFARDPMKQKRYESYLEAMRHNRPYVHDDGAGIHMTDWEKEREKEEFSKAAHLFQPLSNMIASRFTRAKHDDNDTNVELPAEKEKSAQAKAAEMKMFGKLTRQSCEWHPDKMVCRRFNIADPYPESKIVGLRTAKREKCSIFNFLEFPSQVEEENAEAGGKKETELEQVKESDARPMKPLAILATVDLRPRVGQPRTDAVLNAEKTRESSTAVAPSAETNEDAAEDEDRRPPIDLFKAIFEDTDSDESSVDEIPDKMMPVAETSSVLVVPIESVEPFQEDRETEVLPQLTPSIEAKIETAEFPISNEASPSLGAVTDDVVMLESADGSEAFGPALPPPPSVNKRGDQNASDRRSNSKNSKVKGHHKSSKHKHKHKTHKSTSKKHKQKKKKRKKKTTKATSSQSSGSDADYETDGESPSDIDQRLMSKLKVYVEKGKDKESTVKRKK